MNSEGVARCLRRQGQVGVRRRLEVLGVNEVMECVAGTPPRRQYDNPRFNVLVMSPEQ